MGIHWSNITHQQFEKIAYEYAKSFEPNWKWIPTKQTRDGSRDGEAKIVDIKTSFGKSIVKEAWYEAKFTINNTHALPLSRIASTVLVGHNNKDKVELILIVTNASFSPATIYEIRAVLGDKVYFVLGRDIEVWMQKVSQRSLRRKYGFNNNIMPSADNINIIGNPLVIKRNSVHNVVETTSEYLEVNQEYDLFFVLNMQTIESDKYELNIKSVNNKIQIDNSVNLIVNEGNNYINIPFTPVREGEVSSPLMTFTITGQNSQIEVLKKLNITHSDNHNFNIRSQFECEYLIGNEFERFKDLHGVFLYMLTGEPGHGKSRVLNNFFSEHNITEKIYLQFRKGKEITNSLLIIKLLVFIVFGKFFSTNTIDEDDINQLNAVSEYNEYFTEYLKYLTNENYILENVDKLISRENELIPLTNSSFSKLIVLDDLQFLDKKPSQLLLKILNELTTSNHNIFIVTAKRNDLLALSSLDEFINVYATRKQLRVVIKDEDIRQILSQNDVYNVPSSLIRKLKKNMFIFNNFMSTIKRLKLKDIAGILRNDFIKDILTQNDIKDVNYFNLDENEKKIVDIVYFFNDGIEEQFLFDNYSALSINNLLIKRIIRYNHSISGFVPFHDIYLEVISRIINTNSTHLYDYAILQRKQGNTIKYLGVMGYFHTEFIKNKEFFFQVINENFSNQLYNNVYYVLKRFLSMDSIGLLETDYEKAYLYYLFAYTTFNVGESDGKELFEKAYSFINNNTSSDSIVLSDLILSEIANCDYWNLNFTSVKNKFRTIVSHFNDERIKDLKYLKAYYTINCRYMNTCFFQDKPDNAAEIYSKAISVNPCNEANIIRLTLHINFHTFNFEENPLKSYNSLKSIADAQSSLPIKTEFILKTSYLQMGCILNKNTSNDLDDIIHWGKENGLNYNTKIAKLQLAICYALDGKLDLMKEALSLVVDIRDFPNLPLGVYYNLCALRDLSELDFSNAMNHLERQLECFSKFGNSYLNKIKSNKKVVGMQLIEFQVNYKNQPRSSKPIFFVETRF